MKPLGLHTIPLAGIDASDRLRQVDPDHAVLLAENIRQTGRLRQPIEVRAKKKGGYQLIAGGHRLRAAELLGWTEIEAFVFDASDDEARLAEIDENLVRHDLNPLDRAVFLAERKALYERLYPDTKAGVAGGKARQGTATDIMSFARDTAERCGLDERTIRRAVMIASRLAPEVRARIAGTWIAKKQSELLALAKVEPAKRLHVLDLMLDEDRPASSVTAALRLLEGAAHPVSDERQKKLAALRKAWDRAGAAARRAWVDEMAADGRLGELVSLLPGMAKVDRAKVDPAGGAQQIDLKEAPAARIADDGEERAA